MADETGARRPGRPFEVDPGAIAATALLLFTERGVDGVSMNEIAEAAGISRRSLFRWFPSKAALVWGGTIEADERLDAAFAALPAEPHDVADRVRLAYVASIEPLGTTAEITRQRLLLIDDNRQLFAWGQGLRDRLAGHLARHIAELTGEPVDSLRVASVVAAFAGTAYAALVWWARHGGDRSPSEVLDEALRGVRLMDGD